MYVGATVRDAVGVGDAVTVAVGVTDGVAPTDSDAVGVGGYANVHEASAQYTQ